MRSKRQQQQSTRRIRRERRRLGRFVAFSEMLADLTPKPLMGDSVEKVGACIGRGSLIQSCRGTEHHDG